MLSVVVAITSQYFSEDLWKTVWEVRNTMLEDMKKERNKEKMKGFLQYEEVCRFKWAHEKMKESDFYEGLNHFKEEDRAQEKVEKEGNNAMTMGEQCRDHDGLKLLIKSMRRKSLIGLRNQNLYKGNTD
ncbi:unnamed protein product [Dovyalis caffra]|uniref:Uncharacterized protein n=1 Tax=Dovyalis caffra TaxID=77055 RepID=A0AAV1SSP2_9ROSI|nr:unnamed protein product [Dovyalis caffra]